MAGDSSTDDRALLAARARLPEHVVHRGFAAETVVLNLQTGKYHGLNPTAGRMLEVLESKDTVGEAAADIANEYGQPIDQVEQDLCALCADLVERDLIELDGIEG